MRSDRKPGIDIDPEKIVRVDTVADTDDTEVLATGAGVNFLGHFLGTALQFAVHITLARWLGPTAYGLYAIAWTVLRISRTLGQMGLNKGMLRFGAKYYPCLLYTSPSPRD